MHETNFPGEGKGKRGKKKVHPKTKKERISNFPSGIRMRLRKVGRGKKRGRGKRKSRALKFPPHPTKTTLKPSHKEGKEKRGGGRIGKRRRRGEIPQGPARQI